MFKPVLSTWTFCLICSVVLPTFTDSIPVDKDKNEPETMYKALMDKCPHLEKTELQENLKDIFTTKCVDWPKINASNVLSLLTKETRNNTACLLLYESILTFCTKLGDQVTKFRGLIPKAAFLSNYSIQEVCLSTKSYSLDKSEHNISHLLEPRNCFFLCSDIGERGLEINNVCTFSYYFATFNVSKFITNSNSLHQNSNSSNPGSNSLNASLSVVETQKKVADPAFNNSHKQLPDVKPINTIPEAPNPIKTIDDEMAQNVGNVPPVNPLLADKLHSFESKKESDTRVESPKVAEVYVESKVHENNDKQNEGIVKPSPILPDHETNHGSIDSNGAPQGVKNPVNDPEIPPDNVNENSIEANEEKGQANISEGADQAEFMEDEKDAEQEEANAKPDPVLPVEIEQNVPSKKVKPSTVEDEAVSNYNTPEDEMDGDSYFFSYFTVIMCLFIVGYVGYHNRQKILALLLEGKKGKRTGRQGRRPNSANYHKLDSNLEEAITSSCTKNASNVIY